MRPWLIGGAAGIAGIAAYLLLSDDAQASAPLPSLARVYPLRLAAAPFPGEPQPGALVVTPPGFDPARPMRLALYFHGFRNSALNVVGDTAGPVVVGGASRPASHLAEQLASSPDVLLVVPGLRRDVADGDAGQLARRGGVAAFLDELLRALPPQVGPRRLSDLTHLGVMAHSGGYQGAAAVVGAGLPALRSVVLLDALYGGLGTFAAWAERGGRLASIYTASGGTAANSAVLAARLAARPGALIDPSPGAVTVAALRGASAVVKRSSLGHDAVARHYPQAFWEAGW